MRFARIDALAVLLMLSASAFSQTSSVEGHYYLQGVHEVGAELVLKPAGRFAFGMSFGAVDQQAEGQWTLQGNTVDLRSDRPLPMGFSAGPVSKELLGDYGRDPDKPTMLVVRVSTPRYGMVWSNMEVSAEFSNGQIRKGLTGNNGMLGFLQRSEPAWSGAIVRRVGVGYPKGKVETRWFDVSDRAVRGVDVYFEPGAMMPAAFAHAALDVQSDGKAVTALIVRSGDLGPGWRFER